MNARTKCAQPVTLATWRDRSFNRCVLTFYDTHTHPRIDNKRAVCILESSGGGHREVGPVEALRIVANTRPA